MFCISLNYKKANIELRQRMSFPEEQLETLFMAMAKEGISYGVSLSTCNRCEFYGIGDSYKAIVVLAQLSQIDEEELKEVVFQYSNQSAIRHLFVVASGLDSMVKGEDEILGQVKRAYEYSLHHHLTNYELNEIFQGAITCAKKIKTDTQLSKTSLSVSTIAASLCHKWKDGEKTVLIIGGSGEIGTKTMKNLLSYHEFDIYSTSRTTKTHSNDGIHYVSYEDRYSYIDQADIIISATKSPHFTVVYKKLLENLNTKKNRLLIDLAVPRDIDPKIAELGQAKLLTIDDFESIAKSNYELKQQEFSTAEEMIEVKLEELLKTMALHDIMPIIRKGEDENFIKFVFEFRENASAEEFESFAKVIRKKHVIGENL